MNKNLLSISILSVTMSTVVAMPVLTSANLGSSFQIQRRDQTRDEWKNIATASGALALLGLLKKDGTLTFAGTAGALYSLYRYDQDTKSRDRLARARAEYFSRDYFYRDGVRYNRRTVNRNGQRYYQFVRAPKSQQDWKQEGRHDNRNWGRKHHRGGD